MSNTMLTGYPHTTGGQVWAVMDHSGPTSYTTGGETLTTFTLRLPGIDFISLPNPAVTISGNYTVSIIYPSGYKGIPLPSVTMKWYVVATGLEVANGTNLSSELIRIQAIGGVV